MVSAGINSSNFFRILLLAFFRLKLLIRCRVKTRSSISSGEKNSAEIYSNLVSKPHPENQAAYKWGRQNGKANLYPS